MRLLVLLGGGGGGGAVAVMLHLQQWVQRGAGAGGVVAVVALQGARLAAADARGGVLDGDGGGHRNRHWGGGLRALGIGPRPAPGDGQVGGGRRQLFLVWDGDGEARRGPGRQRCRSPRTGRGFWLGERGQRSGHVRETGARQRLQETEILLLLQTELALVTGVEHGVDGVLHGPKAVVRQVWHAVVPAHVGQSQQRQRGELQGGRDEGTTLLLLGTDHVGLDLEDEARDVTVALHQQRHRLYPPGGQRKSIINTVNNRPLQHSPSRQQQTSSTTIPYNTDLAGNRRHLHHHYCHHHSHRQRPRREAGDV